VQTRSDVEVPPIGFVIELTMHAADPAARSCVRTVNSDEDPPERPQDSVRWCASRLVADRWTAKLGPEGRPIDPAHPQLHRIEGSGVCSGVNSGPMTFRMDPMALDPVWLEGTGGYRLIPRFTDKFQPAFEPDFVIVNGAGVVIARDGLRINPNEGSMTGAYLCPTGVSVDFQ
jgi:hypothetical protein